MRQVDTVADPGKRVVQDYLFSGANALNIDTLILLLESLANSQGWTTVVSTTTSGHPDRTLLSVLSPWWDDTLNPGLIPSTYKVYCRVRFYATSNTQLKVRGQSWDGGVVQTAGDTVIPSSITVSLRIHVCPFQILMWRPGDDVRFIAMAPHIPKWAQIADVRELVYVTGNNGGGGIGRGMYDGASHMFVRLNVGGTIKTFDSVAGAPGGGMARFMVASQLAASPRIANPVDDATLTDATKWHSFINPAAFSIPGTLANFVDTNGSFWFGWPWDVISSSRNPNTTIDKDQLDQLNVYENLTHNNSVGSTATGGLYVRTA